MGKPDGFWIEITALIIQRFRLCLPSIFILFITKLRFGSDDSFAYFTF